MHSFKTIAATGVEGVDFTPLSGNLTFAPGETRVALPPLSVLASPAARTRNASLLVALTPVLSLPASADEGTPALVTMQRNVAVVVVVASHDGEPSTSAVNLSSNQVHDAHSRYSTCSTEACVGPPPTSANGETWCAPSGSVSRVNCMISCNKDHGQRCCEGDASLEPFPFNFSTCVRSGARVRSTNHLTFTL